MVKGSRLINFFPTWTSSFSTIYRKDFIFPIELFGCLCQSYLVVFLDPRENRIDSVSVTCLCTCLHYAVLISVSTTIRLEIRSCLWFSSLGPLFSMWRSCISFMNFSPCILWFWRPYVLWKLNLFAAGFDRLDLPKWLQRCFQSLRATRILPLFHQELESISCPLELTGPLRLRNRSWREGDCRRSEAGLEKVT